MIVKPITNEERAQIAKGCGFPKRFWPHNEYLSPVKLAEAYESRLQQLEAALRKIRGWREIGSAVTDYERVQAMEQIADRSLNGDGEKLNQGEDE